MSASKSRQGRITIKRKVKLPPDTHGPVELKQTNFDTQLQQDTTTARQEIDHIPSNIHPIDRPPPIPPDLNDNNRRPEHNRDPNIDLRKIHHTKRVLYQKCMKTQTNLTLWNLKI